MNARDNPFASDRILGIRYRPQCADWDSILQRLVALKYRAAIVGPEGSGKTTLLEDLEQRLGPKGFSLRWLRLDRSMEDLARELSRQVPRDLGPRDLVLFDGADLLDGFAWRRFLRRTKAAGGLLITSHRTGSLPTLVECRTSPALLHDILVELLGREAASFRDAVPPLFLRHRGNIREALRELYDLCADAR